jgi:hypothetical protein
MSKPETTFTAGVHKHLPPGREDPYWMKNNNLYTSGIWDVWYSGPFRDLWVEYKFIELPKRDDTMIDFGLSELQKQWGRDREREGRNLAVIVGCKEGGVILRGPSVWEPTMTRERFAGLLVSRKNIAQWIMDFTVTGNV